MKHPVESFLVIGLAIFIGFVSHQSPELATILAGMWVFLAMIIAWLLFRLQTKYFKHVENTIYQHKRRKSFYAKIFAEAEVQASRTIHEGDMLTIYVGENGKPWARPIEEFNDGRFENVEDRPHAGKLGF